MSKSNIRVLTVLCVLAAAVLLSPTLVLAQGCQGCAAPVVAAPGYVTYMPQTYAYMPTSVYRAVYRPTAVTAYQPVYQAAYQPVYQTAYQPVTTYAYSTYRPLFGWNYRTRLVPYTTYQPIYSAAPVVAYSPYTSSVAYTSYDSCSPCGNSCGTVTYGAASGCSSCAAPAAAPATVVSPPPYAGSSEAAPPANSEPQKTFQEPQKVEKPATDVLKPIPQTDTRLNSMPAPVLRDPRDRTAARSVTTSSRTVLVASPVKPVVRDADGWGPASE